jgi:hypothetical protein
MGNSIFSEFREALAEQKTWLVNIPLYAIDSSSF